MDRTAPLLPYLNGSRTPDHLGVRLLLTLLTPLALLYGRIQFIRAWLYRQGWRSTYRPPVPVISIGNLTTGGTGKTPTAIAIGRHLSQQGYRVALVSRGYGQASKEPVTLVADGQGVRLYPPMAADEAVLAAQRLPGVWVWTGPRRAMVIQHALTQFKAQIILMDDAFQHLAVARTLNIVLLDATRPFGNGRLLPAGLLREPISALQRADILILTRALDAASTEQTRNTLRALAPTLPILAAIHRPVGWRRYPDGAMLPLEALEGIPLLAFCAIARPESFQLELERLNLSIKKFEQFSDHHYWIKSRFDSLKKISDSLGAQALVCTEKDAVKIAHDWLDRPLYTLCVELAFLDDPAPLWGRIEALVNQ